MKKLSLLIVYRKNPGPDCRMWMYMHVHQSWCINLSGDPNPALFTMPDHSPSIVWPDDTKVINENIKPNAVRVSKCFVFMFISFLSLRRSLKHCSYMINDKTQITPPAAAYPPKWWISIDNCHPLYTSPQNTNYLFAVQSMIQSSIFILVASCLL